MKIEMKPIKIEVEIADYGKFYVSPLGAGAEAEIRIITRELLDKIENDKQYDVLVNKEKNGEKLDTTSEEYIKALEDLAQTAKLGDRVKDITIEKMKNVFKGDKVDKLFEDFTYDQIMEIYNKAVK